MCGLVVLSEPAMEVFMRGTEGDLERERGREGERERGREGERERGRKRGRGGERVEKGREGDENTK